MEKLKIKTKRDWCLALIFATLIVYGISARFSGMFQRWLLQYGNPMMTNMNQPKSYGNVIFTIVVMMVIIEIILIRHKKSIKIICILAVAGIAAAMATFGMYLANVDKIVSVIEEEDYMGTVSVGYWAGDDFGFSEEQQKTIVELCEKLEPVSAEEEKKLEEEFYADGEYTADSVLIWATYPEKYGHNFDLMVCVYEDKVFIRKGYGNDQREIVTFFEDNGLIEALGEY